MHKRMLFLTLKQFVFIVYFILTTLVFFLALRQGNDGITLTGLFNQGGDGEFYWTQAQNIVNGQSAILTSIYPLLIGYLLKFVGIHNFYGVYVIRIFNYIGFVLLVLLSNSLVKLLFHLEQGKLAKEPLYDANIVLLFCLLLYTSLEINVNLTIIRDIWIYMFYVLSTILSIKVIFLKKNRLLNLIFLVASLSMLDEFRKYALLSFVLTLILFYSYKWFRRFKNKLVVPIVLFTLFGVYYTFLAGYQVPIVHMSLKAALNYRHRALTVYSGGSQMWINLDQRAFPLFLLNYLYSYVGNLIGPLPWFVRNSSTLVAFFSETIPMVLILRFLWKKRRLISPVMRYVLLHAFVWISLIAVTNDNIGTATRLRPIGWILILVIFSIVYAKNKQSKGMILDRTNRKGNITGQWAVGYSDNRSSKEAVSNVEAQSTSSTIK